MEPVASAGLWPSRPPPWGPAACRVSALRPGLHGKNRRSGGFCPAHQGPDGQCVGSVRAAGTVGTDGQGEAGWWESEDSHSQEEEAEGDRRAAGGQGRVMGCPGAGPGAAAEETRRMAVWGDFVALPTCRMGHRGR